jgi:1-acyl-sn-glycerol-3-phosphate acyltransferase
LKSVLFYLYQIYAWLFFVPVALILTLLAGWSIVLVSWLFDPLFANRVIGRPWGKLLAWLVPMPVSLEGGENADPSRSYVVVANHVSQFDILALYGWLKLDLKWVIKKELRKMPGVGIGCEKAGHIFVDRGNPEQAKNAVNSATRGLDGSVGVLFFAEGTRSLDGKLLRFKKGAFRIALSGQLPVLPVTIIGTGDVLPSKTLRLFPGRVRIVVHPAIETMEDSADNLRRLMNQTRETIASALPEHLRDQLD